jgi:hypothetical protein
MQKPKRSFCSLFSRSAHERLTTQEARHTDRHCDTMECGRGGGGAGPSRVIFEGMRCTPRVPQTFKGPRVLSLSQSIWISKWLQFPLARALNAPKLTTLYRKANTSTLRRVVSDSRTTPAGCVVAHVLLQTRLHFPAGNPPPHGQRLRPRPRACRSPWRSWCPPTPTYSST